VLSKLLNKVMKLSIGFHLIFIWFLIGIVSVIIGLYNEGFNNFMEDHSYIGLIYYISWFPTLIIAGLLMNKSNK